MPDSQKDIAPSYLRDASRSKSLEDSVRDAGELVFHRHIASHENQNPLPETRLSIPLLEVQCLGVFQACIDKSSVCQWWSNKAKSIFKYLVTNKGRAVSKEVLMDVFWPNVNPVQANNNLKTSIQALRQILNSTSKAYSNYPWILFWDGKYMINPSVDLHVDVDRFENCWSAGRQLEKITNTIEAIGKYKDAVYLYTGDYFEEDLYDDWALMHREILKDMYLTILGKLAEYSMQAEDYQECISFCHKILLKDRCREDIYQKLMCCYNRLGQRSTAERWYRICEWAIKEGLDAPPSEQTCSLRIRLLNDKYI